MCTFTTPDLLGPLQEREEPVRSGPSPLADQVRRVEARVLDASRESRPVPSRMWQPRQFRCCAMRRPVSMADSRSSGSCAPSRIGLVLSRGRGGASPSALPSSSVKRSRLFSFPGALDLSLSKIRGPSASGRTSPAACARSRRSRNPAARRACFLPASARCRFGSALVVAVDPVTAEAPYRLMSLSEVELLVLRPHRLQPSTVRRSRSCAPFRYSTVTASRTPA